MEKKNEAAITIDPAKTALLLLHWQNDIAAPGGKMASDIPERLAVAHTIEHTQAVLKATREKGMLVIFIDGSHRPGYPEVSTRTTPLTKGIRASGALVRGTWGSEVIEQLKPLDGEVIVLNYSPNSFSYTELDLILRNKGITDLVLTGLSTNFIVETTARDGVCRGYFIYTLKDCCISSSEEMHNWPVKKYSTRFWRCT